jgi:hypothetical protein
VAELPAAAKSDEPRPSPGDLAKRIFGGAGN